MPEESEAHGLMFLKTFFYEALVQFGGKRYAVTLRDKDNKDIVSTFYSFCLKMSQGMKRVGKATVVMLHLNII